MGKLFFNRTLFLTLFFGTYLNAQIIINIDKPIIETFDFEVNFEEFLNSVEKDIERNDRPDFFNKNDSIIKLSINEFKVVGKQEYSSYWIQLAKPISELAYNELENEVDSMIYTIKFKKNENGIISCTAYLNGFQLSSKILNLEEEGLLKYVSNIKFSEKNYVSHLKKYLWRKTSSGIYKSAKFSREKGFYNYEYSFKDFIPKKNLNVKVNFNENAPVKNILDSNLLITYDFYNSTIYGIDVNKPEPNWKYTIPNTERPQRNYFSIYNGTIYAASEKVIEAINAKNGSLYWSSTTLYNEDSFDTGGRKHKNTMFAQYAPISDDLVFASDEKYIYSLDRFNGKLLWSQIFGVYGHNKFKFDKDYVYKSGLFEMFKIHKKSGEVSKILHNVNHEPLYNEQFLDKNILIFGDEEGNLVGYNTKTDTILWEENTNTYIKESRSKYFSKTDKDFFVYRLTNSLLFIDLYTGKLLNHLTFNDERSIHGYTQNKDYYILHYTSSKNSEFNEEALYIINIKEQELEKIIPITVAKRPISNFSFYDEKTLSFLSKGEINLLDLKTFTIKSYLNDNLQPNKNSYYSIDYHIDWTGSSY